MRFFSRFLKLHEPIRGAFFSLFLNLLPRFFKLCKVHKSSHNTHGSQTARGQCFACRVRMMGEGKWGHHNTLSLAGSGALLVQSAMASTSYKATTFCRQEIIQLLLAAVATIIFELSNNPRFDRGFAGICGSHFRWDLKHKNFTFSTHSLDGFTLSEHIKIKDNTEQKNH